MLGLRQLYNNKIGSLERTVEKKLILFSTMERKGSKLKHQILYGAGMVRMTFIQTKIGSPWPIYILSITSNKNELGDRDYAIIFILIDLPLRI